MSLSLMLVPLMDCHTVSDKLFDAIEPAIEDYSEIRYGYVRITPSLYKMLTELATQGDEGAKALLDKAEQEVGSEKALSEILDGLTDDDDEDCPLVEVMLG